MLRTWLRLPTQCQMTTNRLGVVHYALQRADGSLKFNTARQPRGCRALSRANRASADTVARRLSLEDLGLRFLELRVGVGEVTGDRPVVRRALRRFGVRAVAVAQFVNGGSYSVDLTAQHILAAFIRREVVVREQVTSSSSFCFSWRARSCVVNNSNRSTGCSVDQSNTAVERNRWRAPVFSACRRWSE